MRDSRKFDVSSLQYILRLLLPTSHSYEGVEGWIFPPTTK